MYKEEVESPNSLRNLVRIMASRSIRILGYVQLYEKFEVHDSGSRKEYLGDIPFMGEEY